jgi:TRAP transporter TAXI family solute receptor
LILTKVAPVFVMPNVLRCTALTVVTVFALTVGAAAQDARFFRIGTGGIGGTYYPIGGIIASAISSPHGSRSCDEGGSCGVQGLVAIAQTSEGSVANVEAVATGHLDSGFVQSDIAYWAYTGTGTYRKKKPRKTIRAIANLYPESVHVVARTKIGVESVRDLKGRRVSLDKKGSGALVDARLILKAFGLRERQLKARYLNSESAALRLAAEKLDAFIAVAGYPMGSVQLAIRKSGAQILPLTGKPIEQLLAKYKFFSKDTIPSGVYGNAEPIPTISVNALWIVPETADEELIYQITKVIWNEKSRKLLDEGHSKGKLIQLSTALQGVSVPLHPGARRFYREVGIVE